ncbi:MAG: filamentous hemagglutinin N-terminal domain-containing protein, partial [Candidatus Sedimenticola sp. (ex Thyasira tokunagai)]
MKKCAQKGTDATRLIQKVLALSAGAIIGMSGPAYSGPEGGQVMGGTGLISLPDAATTLIQQQSQNLAIDWQRFNVASNERVLFQQPSASAAVLNRILDQNPSQIFGSIEANGRVFLSNPNGIIFGASATVNVGSLFATGLDMSSADFMSGRYEMGLADGESAGVVINRGIISAATGGSVTLVGGAVSNEGLIIADVGYVNLAAGRKAVVDFRGDGSIRFQVDEAVLGNPVGLDSAVSNSGEIRAEGGQVLLSGHAAQDVFTRVVNNDGVIRAGRIDDSGGTIRLLGSGG